MKKMLAVMLMLLFVAGCGAAARQSEFYEHGTMYKNGNHLLFSILGYKNVDKQVRQSGTEQWWGIPVVPPKQ